MMDEFEFEIGQTYRNRNGAYEVVALHGDKMTVQYEDGSKQTVGVALQARIWANIQIDEAAPPSRTSRKRSTPEDEGLDTRPIMALVERVLATIPSPYPADIIDQVCLAVEDNPVWLREYKSLVAHFSSQGKDGKLTVNSSVGWYVRDLTGMLTIKAGNVSQSSLIQSYSSLMYPPSGETSFWTRVRQLEGSTLATLDQRKPFTITAVTADKMTVMPHENNLDRTISRDAVEGAWLKLLQHGELARQDVKHEFSEWNPAYITAVLAEVRGVEYKIRPIVLIYKKQ